MSKIFFDTKIRFSYDSTADIYRSYDPEPHVTIHKRRLGMMLAGHLVRGRRLAYDYLLDQIDFQDDDWIIDVGANTGDLALAFKAMGRTVNVEAFEPSPLEFSALQQNLEACPAIGHYTAHQLALWNEANEGLTFYLKASKADNSLLPIEGATDTITVECKKLSDVLTDPNRRYRLLKLEAEGVEPEILLGAQDLLQRVDYISADVGFERGIEKQSTLPDVTNYLLGQNFEIVGFGATRLVILFKNKRAP
ncbi:FkbM family methyltransferase [Octadecabacter sp. G9-8]|uniref:FkbM family methyltransferase n=1 Tax=Octadecabacter dasysiphoniae TaxID=2909341 RepID=A0ABS9CZH2_9RHOB|nr:FkbM family methyltransferase [Octadecabacter dasysiphoniae]MCF2872462.1 FkbM family methyltransferase [Octadecabacter dasysiphoniae]